MFILPKKTLSIFIMSLSLIIIFIKLIKKKELTLFLFERKIYISLFIILILTFISAFIGGIKFIQLDTLLIFCIFFIFFIILSIFFNTNSVKHESFFRIIAIVSLIINIYGLIQTAGIDIFPNNFPDYLSEKRIFSTLGNKNFLSYFLAMNIFSFFYFKKKWKFLSIFPIFSIFIWSSRGAIIALLIQGAWYLLKNKKIKKLYKIWLIFLSAFFILLFIVWMSGKSRQFKTTMQSGRYTSSTVQRKMIWLTAFNILKNYPFGIGLGNFENEFFIEQGKLISKDDSYARYICNAKYAHNEFLQVLVEYGIIIGTIIIFLVLFIFFKGYQDLNILFYPFSTIIIASSLSFPIHLPSFILYLFIFLVLSLKRIKYNYIFRPITIFSSLILIFFFIFSSIYFFSKLRSNYYLNKALNNEPKYFLNAYKAFPMGSEINFQFGKFLADNKHFNKALPLLLRGSKLSYDPSRSYYIALCYLYKNEDMFAEIYFKNVLKLDPYHYFAHFYLARLYEKSGKKDLAEQHYKLLDKIIKEKLWQI